MSGEVADWSGAPNRPSPAPVLTKRPWIAATGGRLFIGAPTYSPKDSLPHRRRRLFCGHEAKDRFLEPSQLLTAFCTPREVRMENARFFIVHGPERVHGQKATKLVVGWHWHDVCVVIYVGEDHGALGRFAASVRTSPQCDVHRWSRVELAYQSSSRRALFAKGQGCNGGGMATGGSDGTQLVAMLQSDSAAEREAALRQLYQSHAGAVMGFVFACTGNRPVAEQVVEEVFVGLARAPHSYDPSQERLRSQLVRRAHGLCLQRLPVEYDMWSRRKGETGPWRDLQPEERVTLALAHFGGMTCDEVAGVLGLHSETVAETIQRALQRLRPSAS